MSYIDQENGSRRVAIGGVVLLHIVVGYALISGFAINVITHVTPKIWVGEYPDDPPPPRHDDPPPLPKNRVLPDKPVIDRPTDVTTVGTGPILTEDRPKIDYPPFQPPVTPPQPPQISRARDALPGPSRATWVTTEDYPPGELRNGAQGVVGISVAIGTDGRVTGCEVTASSGSAVLDQTTCRLYARRARFQPALDADGKPIASHRADRIRWQIPE